MPSLPDVTLLLDAPSTEALRPWLSATLAPGISLAVHTTAKLAMRPRVLEVLVEEAPIWLGRTETGLILGRQTESWLSIEGPPALVRGMLAGSGESEQARDLVLAAVLIALRTMGVHVLHAAGVCTGDRALVLVGDSGAGKSTTATALTSAGCRYLGDDGLLLRERSGEAELLGYWPSFRLTDQVLPAFAALKPHLSKLAANDKWRLDTASAFPNRRLTHWLGPTTLLFLARSSGWNSALSSLTSAEALGLLIAQSHALGLEFHPNPRQHLDLLALLAGRAHIARLGLGSEWLEDPKGAAGRLLERAHSCSSPQHLRREAS